MSDNDYRPYANEHEAEEAYKDWIDETNDTVTIAGIDYDPSHVLEEVDPVAFRCGFNDWLDALQRDLPDEDDEEDED